MVEIIGVRFSSAGKIYYFDPKGEQLSVGTKILVETARGVELGHVVIANKNVDDSEIVAPLKPIIRKANEDDFKTVAENKEKEKDAFIIAAEKIREHNIDMKLVDVEYTFDRSKILFYFTADGRVDFRELVKTLASIFHTRIELRQIGVRDEARQIGSYGICGRNLCCGTFLDDFRPVSIKMAKEQGLSLNPTKISGVCGRLMCCLQYEQNAYDDMLKKLPHKGAVVETRDGKGIVVDVATLKGEVKVKFEEGDGFRFGSYKIGEFKPLNSKIKFKEELDLQGEETPEEKIFEGELYDESEAKADDAEEKNVNKSDKADRRGGRPRRAKGKRPDVAAAAENERAERKRGGRGNGRRRGGYNRGKKASGEPHTINPAGDDPEAR